MLRQLLFLLFGAFIGFVACRVSQERPDVWIPVLEGTSFVYLNDPVDRAIEASRAADDMIESNELRQAREDLQKTKNDLSLLRFYYIPMTETRQLVYDADRLFHLGRVPEAKRKLEQAKGMLLGVAEAMHHSLRKPANELILLMDDLLLGLDESPGDAAAKFRRVGERVNLMLLKSDLVLSGAGISE